MVGGGRRRVRLSVRVFSDRPSRRARFGEMGDRGGDSAGGQITPVAQASSSTMRAAPRTGPVKSGNVRGRAARWRGSCLIYRKEQESQDLSRTVGDHRHSVVQGV